MALQRLWKPVPHYSTGRSTVRLIVLHCTEGAQTTDSLYNWFSNPAAKVSSHVGIDNRSRTIHEYVRRAHSAWAQGNYNGVAISVEQCTPSGASNGWSRDTWMGQRTMLSATAEWIAEEAKFYNLPITRLSPSAAQGSGRGVCGHVDIQPADRTDPGRNYPWDYVLDLAKQYAGGGAPPPAATPTGDANVSASSAYDKNGGLHLAALSDKGQVMYFPPGRPDFYAVDPSQSGARSGVGITISKDDLVTLIYTNGSGKVCTYVKPVNTGTWAWSGRGAITAR